MEIAKEYCVGLSGKIYDDCWKDYDKGLYI